MINNLHYLKIFYQSKTHLYYKKKIEIFKNNVQNYVHYKIMLTLDRAVHIYSEMDRIFNEGNSEYLTTTIPHTKDEMCELMKILNIDNNLYQKSYLNGQDFIKSLKVDGEEVIGYKEKKNTNSYSTYSYNCKEYYVDTEKIFMLSNPAPFGKGSETVFDENVRKALEIKAERIELSSCRELEQYFKNIIPMNKKFVYKLYKMQIYEKGGKFNRHKDTIHSPNHYATLVINIPVPGKTFKGGELVLYKNDTTDEILTKCSFKNYNDSSIIFLTDIDHEVKEVTKGVRIVLQYDVYIEDNIQKKDEDEDEDEYEYEDEDDLYHSSDCIYEFNNTKSYLCYDNYIKELEESIDKKILDRLDQFLKKNPDDEVCFLLNRKYPLSTSLDFLKAGDLKLYKILSSVYDIKLGYIVNTFRSSYDGSYEIEDKKRLKVMNYKNVLRFQNFLNGIEDKEEKKKIVNVHTFIAGGDFNCVKSIDYVEHTGNEAAPAEYSYVSMVLCCGKKL